ncbi:MAG: hypothetical protein K6B68_09540 [Eubacterium sp.]|nr:hypothetical protein [Eubacterium sp.]
MPFKAMRDYNKTIPVYADKCGFSDKGKNFYCPTENCKALMHIVHAGDPENAFFRRNSSSKPHISVNCVRYNMSYPAHKYEEHMYNKENMFSYILGTPGKSKYTGTTGTKQISTAPRSAAKTLRTMYEILCDRGIDGIYNKVPLKDIFAVCENYDYYKNNLIGPHIVEVSYYFKPYNENYIVFNYPYNYKQEHILVKMNMPNLTKAIDVYKKLKTKQHTDLILICGNWTPCNISFETKSINKETNETMINEHIISYECNYISGRQIYLLS